MLGKKCSLVPLKEELRKQGVSRANRVLATNWYLCHANIKLNSKGQHITDILIVYMLLSLGTNL